MPLKTPKAVFSASEGKFTAIGGGVKYLGVVLTCDERRNTGIDTLIGKANVVMRERYCSVVAKRDLSKNAKLLVSKQVFVPILTCGNESQATTERIVSKEQTAAMGYLRRVLGVKLRDKTTGLKSVKPGMSSHSSESRNPSCVSCPECHKNSE